MSDNHNASLGSMLGLVIVGLLQSVSGSSVRRAKRRARREAAHAEHKARLQRQQWFALMQKQMARGSAGDASPDEARAALRGSGGRASKLDKEFL